MLRHGDINKGGRGRKHQQCTYFVHYRGTNKQEDRPQSSHIMLGLPVKRSPPPKYDGSPVSYTKDFATLSSLDLDSNRRELYQRTLPTVIRHSESQTNGQITRSRHEWAHF